MGSLFTGFNNRGGAMKKSKDDEQGVAVDIVDDLPLVPIGSGNSGKFEFFEQLEVGQCALVEVGLGAKKGVREPNVQEQKLRTAASRRNRTSEKKFVIRRIPDRKNHVGVWRLE